MGTVQVAVDGIANIGGVDGRSEVCVVERGQ
jgi:hypothetical protein